MGDDRVTTPAVRRCFWATGDPLLQVYHDEEWGVPEHDGRRLWEKLVLDGFQAGLSWLTILRKRERFRTAFRNFDPRVVARYKAPDVERLLSDAGIVRSRSKIEATIAGARAYLALEKSGTDFAQFAWSFTGGQPIQNTGPVPTHTPLSVEISVALKDRGFRFVGPVIVYAWMQATGMVNDHALDCFRRAEVQRAPSRGTQRSPRAPRAPR
jgi:DNA-3-methyladenine glycosylase I